MELKIEVYGITHYVSQIKRIVFPDGRKPRLSVNDGSIIESHQPFIAFEQGTYAPPAAVSPTFSFRFDIDAAGDPRSFDAWFLDGHTISVMGPVPGLGQPDFTEKTRVCDMGTLAPGLLLSPDVTKLTSKAASGWLDVSTAREVGGEADGPGGGILIQSAEGEVTIANRFTVHYEVGAPATTVRVGKGPGPGDVTDFALSGKGPWTVMAGNAPLGQLLGADTSHDLAGAPLTHLELVYDLYDFDSKGGRPVPRLARGHVHTMTVAGGLCGPVSK
ncbi:MAG: hypothetical protein ABI779_04100 [Acidobacteriota bacterium]